MYGRNHLTNGRSKCTCFSSKTGNVPGGTCLQSAAICAHNTGDRIWAKADEDTDRVQTLSGVAGTCLTIALLLGANTKAAKLQQAGHKGETACQS